MPKLLHYSEKVGCGFTARLDSGEPCMISVAQSGVRVKKSRLGILGATLYDEKNVYRAAQAGMALDLLFDEVELPVIITNRVLRAFAKAVSQSPTAANVAIVLNSVLEQPR